MQPAAENDNDLIAAAAEYIQHHGRLQVDTAIILGTGLGDVTESMQVAAQIPYSEIPGFRQPTAIGHHGRLLVGKIASRPVIVLRGRLHSYEGYEFSQLTFPVRVLRSLGVTHLVTSCAAGALNPHFQVGDLMLVRDFVSFLKPARMTDPIKLESTSPPIFASELSTRLHELARRHQIKVQNGVYVAVTGPNYETRAEIRYYRQIADAIGMSVIPEVACATQLGMNVLAMAAITNLCCPDTHQIANADHVTAAAERIVPQFRRLIVAILAELPKSESSAEDV